MLASFPGSFPSLAVRVGPYCKQQEAGRGFQGYGCAASDTDTSSALLAETWHYFCVLALSSMCQRHRMLVVNYFRCTSGTLPISGPAGRQRSKLLHTGYKHPHEYSTFDEYVL